MDSKCAPQTCHELNERIAIKQEAEVSGNIINQAIREHCRECGLRNRKTSAQIASELGK